MPAKINTKELLEILEFTPADQNIMLVGRHGVGKSQILSNYYESKGFKVVTLFLGQMSDPGDLIGLPRMNTELGITEFIPPYWFPISDEPIVLFLDELNRARSEILQTIMDLTLNRKLAGHVLPKGSRIISAVNDGDEYQLTDLDPALVSRFNIYTFEPDIADWISWAKKTGIDSRVIDYIENNGEKLEQLHIDEDEDMSLEKTPDRRAWEKVSNVIKSITELKKNHIKLIAGIIGLKTATDFVLLESKKEVKKISAKELLTSGEVSFPALNAFSLSDFPNTISTIFGILNKDLTEDEKKKYAQSFTDLVKYLKEEKLFEPLGYLTSLYAESDFTKASEFIANNCAEAVELMLDFAKSAR